MARAIIKIQDAGESGALDVEIDFTEAINNNSNAHQFAARIVELLNSEGHTEAQAETIQNGKE